MNKFLLVGILLSVSYFTVNASSSELDDGKMYFKLQGAIQSLPNSYPTTNTFKYSDFPLSTGIGLSAITEVIFHNYLGFSLDLGITGHQVSLAAKSPFTDASSQTPSANAVYLLRGNLEFALKPQIAPYGAIRLYGLGGIAFTYNYPVSSNGFATSWSYNTVIGGGVNTVFKDDGIIGFEIKKYFLGTVDLATTMSSLSRASGNITIAPLSIAINIGYSL